MASLGAVIEKAYRIEYRVTLKGLATGAQHLHGLGPDKRLWSNPQFGLASQV